MMTHIENWPPRHRLDDWCTSIQTGMLNRSHHRFRILTTYYLDRCQDGAGLIPEQASDRARFKPRSCAHHRASDLYYWGRLTWTGKIRKTDLGKMARILTLSNSFWKDCQQYHEPDKLIDYLWMIARHDQPPHHEEDRVAKAITLWAKMSDEERDQFRHRAKQIPPRSKTE